MIIYLTVDEQSCNMAGELPSSQRRVRVDTYGDAGNMHGGCIAYLVDICSSLPLLALSGHERWPTSGVSTNISTYYIAAAPVRTYLPPSEPANREVAGNEASYRLDGTSAGEDERDDAVPSRGSVSPAQLQQNRELMQRAERRASC